MTDAELRECMVETSRQIRELGVSQSETGQQIRDLRASQEQTNEQIRASQDRTDQQIRELRASQDQTDQQIRELQVSQKRTDKQLRELGNRFGGFTEGMALPSIREILYEKFGVTEDLEQRVIAQGIYLAKIHCDLFQLVTPEGFELQGFPG